MGETEGRAGSRTGKGPETPAPDEGPYRILAVDDDALALNLVKRVFERDPDVQTVVTPSPREALALARAESFDLILADQRMGEMTGLEMLQELRGLQPDAVRILLTAYPDVTVALQAINEGLVYRFVLKPWNIDDMRITIRRAIEARRMALENERLSLQLRAQFQELVEKERMAQLGRLSAGLGHELGNAVTPLLVQLTLLSSRVDELLQRAQCTAQDDPLAVRVQSSLDSMRLAGRQVMAVVSGLKGYAHKAGVPAPWNANTGVTNALQLLAHRLRDAPGVEVSTDLGAVPTAVCRGDELVQVLLNLLGNALDEVKEAGGGRVVIRTFADENWLAIEVKDTGRGLHARVRENLFAPFVSTKPQGVGTGLGLSICKNLVEANGGRIAVETAEGRGTTFRVELPLAPAVQGG